MRAKKKSFATATVEATMAAAGIVEMTPPPGPAYASLRLKEQGHPLRFSHGPKLVQATNEQTITYLDKPYPHFRVDPGGVEFPLDNVASAMQTGAAIVQKLSRAGRLKARAERLQARAQEKQVAEEPASPRQRAGVQVIDDEDDEPLAEEVDDGEG